MKLSFVILIFFSVSTLNAQQAWHQKKGEGYFQMGASYLNYSYLHIGNLDIIKMPRPVTEVIYSSYNEYGITNKLTGVINVPFHSVSVSDFDKTAPAYQKFDKGKLSAFGNISTALLYNLFDKKGIVISTKLKANFNTSSRQLQTGLSTGYDAFILESSILGGIGKSTFFASGEVSVVISPNNFLSRININAQIGKRFLKKKQLILIFSIATNTYLNDIAPSNSLTVIQAKDFTGLYHPKQGYYAINLKAGYEFNSKWSIWASFAGGEATNIGAGINSSLAIAYKLKNK